MLVMAKEKKGSPYDMKKAVSLQPSGCSLGGSSMVWPSFVCALGFGARRKWSLATLLVYQTLQVANKGFWRNPQAQTQVSRAVCRW